MSKRADSKIDELRTIFSHSHTLTSQITSHKLKSSSRHRCFTLVDYFKLNNTTMVIPGGHSESKKEISAQVQNIADQIKTELEGKVKGGGNKFNVYEVLEYKQQVVAGMVYHMKIRIDDLACNNCIHVRVFQPLQYTQQGPEIQKYKMHTTIEDPLEIL